MVLSGFRIVHVPRRVVEAYSYRRKFTIKDKPDKPKKSEEGCEGSRQAKEEGWRLQFRHAKHRETRLSLRPTKEYNKPNKPASSCLCRLADHWPGGFPRVSCDRTRAVLGHGGSKNPRSPWRQSESSGRDIIPPIFCQPASWPGALLPLVVARKSIL